jgi:hypothetical protein
VRVARRRFGTGALLSLLAFLAGLAVALALDAFWIEPDSIAVVRHVVALDDAPPPLSGLRIAVIADLHAGARFIGADKVRRVVALTDAARPDLILLAGDYTGARPGSARYMTPEAIAQLLKPLAAPLGVYAVLGNHDHWEGGPRFAAALRAVGIAVLDNRSRILATPRGPLTLVGIDDAFTHHADPVKALAGVGPGALCFTHSPDIFPALPRTCRLTVAGHTHGGQVDLPLFGRLIVPSKYDQRYAAGLVREGGKTLFVSTGIGTSIVPVRFAVPPEVSLLEIR